ncbi:MAG: ribose transport system ATP-binding protein [Gaiellaceae bacterium]|nr:ribose transport system ATP-binding protein [Gaiellaceae bacterium]
MRLLADRVVKVFPGVRALDGATLALEPGTVHALLGENGAGKSTLIKILTGVYHPTDGSILIGEDDGDLHPISFSGPLDAQRAGIGVVHQERNVVPAFSVAENVSLHSTPRKGGLVDRPAMRARAERCFELLDVQLDLDRPVAELSVAQTQLVEVAKALALDSRILLLDEPSASLTSDEADHLYAVVRRLRDDGRCVVLVSHKLEEVFAVADTVTVLRDGRSVAAGRPLASFGRGEIVDLMVGRAFADSPLRVREPPSGDPVFELDGLATAVGHEGVSLSVRRGEIVGLYGLVGAGRSELARAVLGLERITAGEIRIGGRPARIANVADALRRYRVGYVSENRKEEGVFLDQPASRNVAVTVWSRLARLGLVKAKDEDALVSRYGGQLDIRLSGPRQLAGQLSGGNQQKLSLAKWLAASCEILVVDEPTVGIDVRTKAAFHDLIGQLASDGMGILLISSDLREMVALADRIAVMRDHRITGEITNDRNYPTMSQAVIRLIHSEVATLATVAEQAAREGQDHL